MSSKKANFNDMTTDEMRKHLFQYNNLVKKDAELKGIRTMKITQLLDNMRKKFQIIKDTKGFYALPREKKVLEVIVGNQRKFFKDNRPEKFKKKIKLVVKEEEKKEEPKEESDFKRESDNLKSYETGKLKMTAKVRERTEKRISNDIMSQSQRQSLLKRLQKIKIQKEEPKEEPKKEAPKKKQRTAKQLANDKRLGELAKKRAKDKKKK